MKCCSCGSTEPKPAAEEDEEESIPARSRVRRRTPHQLTDLHVSPRRNRNHNPLPLGPPLFIGCHYFFFSLVDFSFSFVSYLKVGVLTGVPLGFPEGPVFIGLHYSNYPSSKVQSASAFNTGSPLHNLLLLESPSVSCYQRKTGKIACLYGLLFLSPNPWDLCLALPHRMLTIKSNS